MDECVDKRKKVCVKCFLFVQGHKDEKQNKISLVFFSPALNALQKDWIEDFLSFCFARYLQECAKQNAVFLFMQF